ncbi:hypothetical protein HaLaN_07476 [Haematococcus lacustris]|uniref:Uncharacterized protein n=1 Tax=Haematococcus lacustris TaxID=44745 RepID=A0A699YWD7_HAELA|nr:hypothetical protein HaLaN_07476 [Haematococcus lacustris]
MPNLVPPRQPPCVCLVCMAAVGGGHGEGFHGAPWACQAAGGPGAQASGGAGWCLWMSTAPPGSAQQ